MAALIEAASEGSQLVPAQKVGLEALTQDKTSLAQSR